MTGSAEYRPIRNSVRLLGSRVRTLVCEPDPDLAPYVLEFWQYEMPAYPPHLPNQIYPSGVVILRFDISEHAVGAVLYGPSISPRMRGLFFANVRVFGVALRPGRASSVLGLPISDLRDLRVQLDALWPGPVRELRERLWEASSFEARVRRLGEFLRGRIRRHQTSAEVGFHDAFRSMLLTAEVDASKRAAGPVSARSLRRHFDRYVGLGPKEMSRVLRFQGVLGALVRQRPIRLSDLALRAGYSDQAHLVRDFASLIGAPPARFASYLSRLHEPDLPIWSGLSPERYRQPAPPVTRISGESAAGETAARRLGLRWHPTGADRAAHRRGS